MIDSLHFIISRSNYTAMNVMVTARTFWAPMNAGVVTPSNRGAG
jgi:hypothetical protein